MSQFGENETLALTALIIMYCFFRVAFTVCYVFALQPMRTIAFVLANMCVASAALVMVNSAFNVDGSNFVPK
jgi:uncharacterized MAPEG superfamily protein